MAAIDDLQTMVAEMQVEIGELRAMVKSIPSTFPGHVAQCTPEMPHSGKLVYFRGPNTYRCECGMQYVKNAANGGLSVKEG